MSHPSRAMLNSTPFTKILTSMPTKTQRALGVLWELARSEHRGNLTSAFLLCGTLEACAKSLSLLIVQSPPEHTLPMSGMNQVLGEHVARRLHGTSTGHTKEGSSTCLHGGRPGPARQAVRCGHGSPRISACLGGPANSIRWAVRHGHGCTPRPSGSFQA